MLKRFIAHLALQLLIAVGLWADGQLGLDPEGKLSFTLLQYQEPYSQHNRQSILWPNAKTLERKGQLHAIHWDQKRLLLAYSKTIFEAKPAEDLLLIQKAPMGYIYICLGKALDNESTPVALLRESRSGRFYRWSGGTSEPKLMPILDTFQKSNAMSPWASSQFPAIWIPKQEEVESHTLCLLSPDLVQCQFFSEESVKSFDWLSFSETSEGLWLLPEQGLDGLFWDGHQLTSRQLPKPELADAQWLHLAEYNGTFSHGLLNTKDGIQLKDKTGLHLIGGEKEAKRENYERPLWQQSLIFVVMITSFLVILRWRETAGAQLAQKNQVIEKAPLVARSFAFLMDLFILNTPMVIISNLLEIPQVPGEELLALMSQTDPTLQIQQLLELSQIMISNLLIVVSLATIYHSLMDVYFSGSIGKQFFRLSVISTKDPESTKVTWSQALLKSALRSLDFVVPIPPNLIFAMIHKDNLSLADRVAKVQVVRKK
jgi:uncharacterized RDD family membrane protein YckC